MNNISNGAAVVSNEKVLHQNRGKLYNFLQLEQLAGANQEFLTSLAKIFITSTVANSEDLLAAAASGKWQIVSGIAHKMKSTIDNLSIESIKKDIRLLECDGRQEINTPALLKTAIKVNDTIVIVAREIKQEFNL